MVATNVKFYKQVYEFLKLYNSQDTTFKTSLLNAIRRIGKQDYLGIPFTGYTLIIFRSSPHFATSHGFKLNSALINHRFNELADILNDLFTNFWKSQKDRESLEAEINKIEAGEVDHPNFITDEEHIELARIENLPESPNKQGAYENFLVLRGEQFQAPYLPAASTEPPSLPSRIPSTPSIPSEPATETKPKFQIKPLSAPFRSLRIPQDISLPIKKFINRNLTLTKLASVITGGIGAIVGYGVTNTGLGALAGGGLGVSIPSLVKSRGAGQLVLTGFTKAGNAGATFISGLSGREVGRVGGGFLQGSIGAVGKKWALVFLLIFLLLAVFLVGFTPAPGTPGGGQPTTTGSGTATGSNTLGYYIPYRDTTIRVKNPDDIKNQVRTAWPNAQLQNWDTIVNQSIANGWNPAFVLTLWIEESGAQGVTRYDDALGCQPTNPTTDINVSLRCLFNSFPISRYPNEKFADFMCMYSESKLAPCQFITNPNFPKNIKEWYLKLVPDGPGALQIIPTGTPPPIPSSSTDQVATCPLSQSGSGSFNTTCGTFQNPTSNRCGHGDGGYPPVCKSPPYASCPGGDYSAQLKAAIDVRPSGSNGNNSSVYLPFIQGNQPVDWTLSSGPITLKGGEWGVKLEYSTSLNGKQYRIDLTHLDQTVNLNARRSGEKVGTTKACVDKHRDGTCEGGHLHTAISVDGRWIDAISEAKLCTP